MSRYNNTEYKVIINSLLFMFIICICIYFTYIKSVERLDEKGKLANEKFNNGVVLLCKASNKSGATKSVVNNVSWTLSNNIFIHSDGRYFNNYECSEWLQGVENE